MSAYRTVVVGTDGSESSLRAVPRAGALAEGCGARLVIACAHLPGETDDRELQQARDADLLVVGKRGLDSITGRLLGSVPADATRRSACDVLVVHTTG